MTDTPIDFRPDGSIVFDIDDVTIRWRPPAVRHIRKAKNLNRDVAIATQTLRPGRDKDDLENPDFDFAALLVDIDDLAAGWVRTVHDDLRLEGDLPTDVEDWPHWLPTLRFSTRILAHWGAHPFAWKITDIDQTETVP